MNLELAQKLDSILLAFGSAPVKSFPFSNHDEKKELEMLFMQLKTEGYLTRYGIGGNGDGTIGLPAFISPMARSFILSGGYTTIVKKELKKEEDERAMMEYLQTASQIANQQPAEEHRSRKWIWATLIIISAVYFFFTKDSNKELWENIDTYISIIGGALALIGWTKS